MFRTKWYEYVIAVFVGLLLLAYELAVLSVPFALLYFLIWK